MSGSVAALRAIHQIEGDAAGAKALFEAEGVEIVSARETEREGRKFEHVEARFGDWDALCRTPAFRGRDCRLTEGEEGLALELSLPSPREAAPEELDPQAVLALRYHFPSTIHYHNSPGGIERGNILAWKRTLREHFAGRPLDVEVRFDRRTILAGDGFGSGSFGRARSDYDRDRTLLDGEEGAPPAASGCYLRVSFSIRPSRRRMTRFAWAATSSS